MILQGFGINSNWDDTQHFKVSLALLLVDDQHHEVLAEVGVNAALLQEIVKPTLYRLVQLLVFLQGQDRLYCFA